MDLALIKHLTALFLLLALALEQPLAAGGSKIAYKKPIYGKTNYLKEKRYKPKTTTTEAPTTDSTNPTTDWLAPVEFIINTTPRLTQTTVTSSNFNSGLTLPLPATSTEPYSATTSTTESNSSYSSTTGAPHMGTTLSSLSSTLPTPPPPPTLAPTSAKQPQTLPQPQASNQPVPCTCGVFLSSQMQSGTMDTPLILNELDRIFPCNAIGRKQCQTKCLEAIVQHLPNSANIVCATLGHDCFKERAYLFIKNCQNQWWNTNLQAGREYCCKGGQPYRCPLLG